MNASMSKFLGDAYRRNGIHRLALLLTDDIGINLGRADIGVSQQFADGIQIGSIGQAQRGKGVAGHMEGDVLGKAGCLGPFIQ